MASNILPNQLDRLFTRGDDMVAGATAHGAVIGIVHNTAPVISAALAAARGAEMAYGDSKTAKKAATAILRAADSAAQVFISNSRKRLAKFFGEGYNAEWSAAGFPENSTGVPTTQDERFNLVESLRLHFTNHPSRESEDMDATAALAASTRAALVAARAGVDAAIIAQGQAKAARDTAVENLRKIMSDLIRELDILISDEDMRWHAFGLSRPADEDTPESPAFTTLTPGGAATMLVDWDDPLRADRYRVWLLIVGTDTEFQPVQTVYDSDATLTGLPPGATIKVRVTSVNDAGESSPGPEAEAVVP